MEQELILTGEGDKGLRPGTLPPTTRVDVVDFRFFLFLFVLLTKMFMVMRYLDMGFIPGIPATITPITQVGMVDCWVALLLHILLKNMFMVVIGVVPVAMMKDVDLGLKRIDTLLFTIAKKVLMDTGEV